MPRATLLVGLLGAGVIGLAGCGDVEPPPTDGGPPTVATVKLDPPPSGKGFQIGTPEFEVPPGMEIQDCYFIAVPGTPGTDVWVKKIQIAQNPGTHHMNLFRLGSQVNLWGSDGDVVYGGECWKSPNWADWPLIANSQLSDPKSPVNNWELPEGVGLKLQAGEVLMLQTHYVNATTQVATNGKGKVLVNFYTDDAATFTKGELGSLFATNQGIRVCPGDTDKYFQTTCNFASSPITIIAASSHFHSRGTYFSISVNDPTTGNVSAPFYENTSWDNPLWKTGMNIAVPAQGGVSYRCEYTVPATDCGDPDQACCFTFGGHVETQEHCNIFVYYYPKTADHTACF